MRSEALIAIVTGYLLVDLLMPRLIDRLKRFSFNQEVSEYSLQEYKDKAKTPTMGGLLFILVPIVVTIVLSFIRHMLRIEILIVLLVYAGYGLIGLTDDYLIVVNRRNDGLTPSQKFLMQVVLAMIFYLAYRTHAVLDVGIPFTGKTIYLGSFYAPLILFMFTGTSNAVNLTDGMDGLAAGCTVISLIPFLIYAFMEQRGDVIILISSLLGALIAYLKYNVKPAKIFMGDTGALALGAILAAIAMLLKKELSLILIGGVFVIETLCVIIQQIAVRTIHRKVFIYTPIHYAFVIKGMGEKQVVRLFWIAAAVLAAAGFFIGLN